MKKILLFLLPLLIGVSTHAQTNFRFAFLSDTHIGAMTGAEDLERSVADINAQPDLKFVILTGDLTDFGADKELLEVKSILNKLNKPIYVIPGNHESTWSESGTNSFSRVFGSERICFKYGGYLFVGTACGPSMKMSPGQVPREDVVWLDSVLSVAENKSMPLVFLNHYPMDSSVNNWYEMIDLLRKRDTRIILHGHGHIDHVYNYDGIPGVMGRSNLRAKADTGAYNIVTISHDSMYFQDKIAGGKLDPAWTVQYIGSHDLSKLSSASKPSFEVNKIYPKVHEVWRYVNSSDIGSGLSENEESPFIYTTDTKGNLLALRKSKGTVAWRYRSEGKIYSVPFVRQNRIVFGSSNGCVYGVDATSGKEKWRFRCQGAVVGSPLVAGDTVYIGASDGHFRALDLMKGSLIWDYDVKGFVIDRPLLVQGHIYFGSWGGYFYALDARTGGLDWKWNNGSANRMFSPAGCWPVFAKDKIFIVAPDNYMTSLDALTGRQIARHKWPERVRESMGLSRDSSLVYVKTMMGKVWGIGTASDSLHIDWTAKVDLGYDIIPTHLVNTEVLLFVPTQSGVLVAINKENGQVAWKHKISNCMITGMQPIGKNKIIVSTSDGVVVQLAY